MSVFGKIPMLWGHLSKIRRVQFFLILIMMLFASVAEIFSLGAVIPFLAALTSPELLFNDSRAQPLIIFFGIKEPNELILPITIVFIAGALLAGILRILLLVIMTKFSFSTGADLSIEIYRRTLYKPYTFHLDNNSSEVINGIMTKTNTVIGGIITPTLNSISSIILLCSILLTLLIISPFMTLSAFSIFFLLYSTIFFFMKFRLESNGHIIAKETTNMFRSLREGLGAIREVIIFGSQEFYAQYYRKADLKFREASAVNVIITSSPRFAMEAVGMSVIAILAFVLFNKGNGNVVPLLGALALGSQRMLPVLQLLYSSYSTISGSDASFQDVLNLLGSPHDHKTAVISGSLPFEKQISLVGVSYRYKENLPYIFKDVNLTIKKGSKVGFIGETGCGKSTLLDIMMGLLKPSEGHIYVDD